MSANEIKEMFWPWTGLVSLWIIASLYAIGHLLEKVSILEKAVTQLQNDHK